MPWRQWANRPLMERGWIFFCASYSATISPCAEVSDAPDAPDASDATGVIGMPGLRSGGSPQGCMVLLRGLCANAGRCGGLAFSVPHRACSTGPRHRPTGHGVAHATGLLRAALAGLGAAPDGAVRPGRAAFLHLRVGAVSAGLHLSHRLADHRGAGTVPVHGGGRAALVRL